MTEQPRSPFWHPFADMTRVAGNELTLLRGEGCWVWDADGNAYLDGSAGLWYCNIGHGRSELAEVAAAQMSRLASYQTFDVLANEPVLELAARLARIAPMEDAGVFFTSGGGSDAVDTVAKIARRYWQVAGHPERTVIVARVGAYHGMNAYGTSLAGIEPNAHGWGPLVREVAHVPENDAGALADLLERQGERVAAFIGEPVIGAGGVIPPVDGYWQDVQDLCRAHDVLLICDEVITGFGRVGEWFAAQRYDIEPDLVTIAKGLTSGYLPAGAVLCGPRVRDMLWSSEAGAFRHGYTYSGHPTVCAVALANLDIIEREDLAGHVRALESTFAAAVEDLATHELVGTVRTAGLLAGVELEADARAAAPFLAEDVVGAARANGLLVRNLLGRVLQISPPLVITENEVETLVARLSAALDQVLATSSITAA